MKEQGDKLTLQETEQLCRQYMDCNLSVLEETELRYFLTLVDYHSPLIAEVRQLMDIDTYISDKPFVKTNASRKLLFRKRRLYLSIAASVIIVIGVGLSLWHYSIESKSYFVAYVDGQRLSEEAARLRIETEKKSVDDFIKEMSELEACKQHLIDNFCTP